MRKKFRGGVGFFGAVYTVGVQWTRIEILSRNLVAISRVGYAFWAHF